VTTDYFTCVLTRRQSESSSVCGARTTFLRTENSKAEGEEMGWIGQRRGTYGFRPTQPSTLRGTENEYQPKCGDALQLGSKGRYGSFHLWINVWVAGKTV